MNEYQMSDMTLLDFAAIQIAAGFTAYGRIIPVSVAKAAYEMAQALMDEKRSRDEA